MSDALIVSRTLTRAANAWRNMTDRDDPNAYMTDVEGVLRAWLRADLVLVHLDDLMALARAVGKNDHALTQQALLKIAQQAEASLRDRTGAPDPSEAVVLWDTSPGGSPSP